MNLSRDPHSTVQQDSIVPRTRFRRRSFVASGMFVTLLAMFTHLVGQVRGDDPSSAAAKVATEVTNAANFKSAAVLNRSLPSAGGSSITLRELTGKQATVFIFLSTECPISNGYIPTLNQLATDYRDQGVNVVGINSNDGCSLRDMASHRKEFAINFPVLKDAGAVVANELAATHCPEAILLDGQGIVRYRGRIDDRYSRRGGPAGDVQSNDLTRALLEVLDGKTVSVPMTKVMGCPITSTPRQPQLNAAVTYSQHVAPVLQLHCENCHRPGGIGPFALQTYEQAVLWADDIREFTANRQMPPWLPDDEAGDFHNRRVMPDAAIKVIQQWVEAGCAEGDRKLLPAPRQFSDDWEFGPPDLIVQPDEPFDVPADGKDVYRCFVIPTDFDTDQFVQAVEVRPGNSRVVHHVIVFLDTGKRSQQLDAQDAGPGYSTSAGFPGFLPAGGLGGWAPGNLPRRLPEGVAKVLPSKAKLVVQVHYHPSGKAERDQTQIGLYFNKSKVTRVVRVLPVMPFGGPWSGMKIPANDKNAQVRVTVTLPRDVLALTITPHMHLLGKDMTVIATLPVGTSKTLIKLKRWDFNWQESYQIREPMSLPQGTRLDLVAHFDNSADNPANPSHPPRDVRWGENTVDEMCIAFLEFVPTEEARSPKDLKAPTPLELLREAVMARLKNEPAKK